MYSEKYQSLWEVLNIIKNAFDDFISYQTFLVEAEVKKINQYNNFYYIDLVQIKNWKIVEKTSSNIFNPNVMKSFLLETWINNIQDLIWKKLLLTLRPSFHKTYWFSFNILRIHTDYFLWALEKAKKETIQKLQKLAIFEKNKQLNLWYPSFHIAIITWKESEWFRDFDTIIRESWYNITYDVYPSLVHGEKASSEVLNTMKDINFSNYDAFAIMRWWWWSDGMNWTNDFELNKFICELEIPVISAVGHTIDKNIIDMVSRYDCKTPSEAASILIWMYEEFYNQLNDFTNAINKNIINIIKDYTKGLSYIVDNINVNIKTRFKTYLIKIEWYNVIYEYIKNQFRNIKASLNTFDSIIRHNNPSKIISKGYNLVYDSEGNFKTEYEVWKEYILDSKWYKYNINVLSKIEKTKG